MPHALCCVKFFLSFCSWAYHPLVSIACLTVFLHSFRSCATTHPLYIQLFCTNPCIIRPFSVWSISLNSEPSIIHGLLWSVWCFHPTDMSKEIGLDKFSHILNILANHLHWDRVLFQTKYQWFLVLFQFSFLCGELPHFPRWFLFVLSSIRSMLSANLRLLILLPCYAIPVPVPWILSITLSR